MTQGQRGGSGSLIRVLNSPIGQEFCIGGVDGLGKEGTRNAAMEEQIGFDSGFDVESLP